MLLLHKQLSIILRVVSFTGQINVDLYEQLCQNFSINLINNFPFALLNDTLHATVHHSPELIRNNEDTVWVLYQKKDLKEIIKIFEII